jgi:hypothetical protein
MEYEQLWGYCRLKSSAGNKTIESLNRLKCDRRTVITGTPLQNNLEVLRPADRPDAALDAVRQCNQLPKLMTATSGAGKRVPP